MYNVYLINGSARIKVHDADPATGLKALGTGKEAVNSVDSFELTLYPDNPGYSAITPMKTMLEVFSEADGRRRFRGRALKPTGDMNASGLATRKFKFESELSYLWDSVQSYHTADTAVQMLTMMLADHNAQQPADKRIQLGQVIVTKNHKHTWHYVKTMQAIIEYIRDYGGEIRLRYGSNDVMYLDYTDTVWSSGSDTKIELAVNMQSVSWTLDPTVIASGIYAVGAKLHDDGSSAERLELGEVIWDPALVAEYGEIVAIVEWDDVTLASNLRTKAAEWLANQKGALHQYSITAVDLSKIDKSFDEFEVGSQYAVVNPLIGLDDVVRCIGKTWSINDVTRDRLTFGDRYETLTALTSAKSQALSAKIDKVANDITTTQEQYVQQVVATQTALLRGAEGGYRYDRLDSNGKPVETFYLNAPSIETATQALRINQNGLGFWSGQAGGALNGPYTAAWTIDGTFNTSYIVGRAITGFTFNNGDGTFKVEANGAVTAKALSVVNGTINCGNGKFTVDSNGNVVANSLSSNNATITGGTVTITTNDQTASVIQLKSSTVDSAFKPEGFESVGQSGNDTYTATVNAFLGVMATQGSEGAGIDYSGVHVYNSQGQSKATINTSGYGTFEKLYVKSANSGVVYDVGAKLDQI